MNQFLSICIWTFAFIQFCLGGKSSLNYVGVPVSCGRTLIVDHGDHYNFNEALSKEARLKQHKIPFSHKFPMDIYDPSRSPPVEQPPLYLQKSSPTPEPIQPQLQPGFSQPPNQLIIEDTSRPAVGEGSEQQLFVNTPGNPDQIRYPWQMETANFPVFPPGNYNPAITQDEPPKAYTLPYNIQRPPNGKKRARIDQKTSVPRIQSSPVSISGQKYQVEELQSDNKLPIYIQHMLHRTRANPAVHTPENRAPDLSPFRVPLESSFNSPDKILESLSPEKLEQLRQLLNSQNAQYGGSNPMNRMDQRSMLDNMPEAAPPRGGNTRYGRTKRDIDNPEMPFAKLASFSLGNQNAEQVEGQTCVWRFKKGAHCKGLILRMQYFVDGGFNCEEEYLTISGGRRNATLCAQNEQLRPEYALGNQFTVVHFKKAPFGNTQFSGSVACT